MTTTTDIADRQNAQSAPIRWERLAGAAAITFAVVVGAGNAFVPQPPAFDASGTEVATWISDNYTASIAGVAAFPITGLCLALFVAGFLRRVRRSGNSEATFFAHVGALGVIWIMAGFSIVEVARLALLAMNGSTTATPELVELVWHFEAAAFTMNIAAIGVAVMGVGCAATRIGLAPKWYMPLSIVALVVGLAAAVQSAGVVNGADGWQIGFVTFISWLVLLLIVGIRMVRETGS